MKLAKVKNMVFAENENALQDKAALVVLLVLTENVNQHLAAKLTILICQVKRVQAQAFVARWREACMVHLLWSTQTVATNGIWRVEK